MTSPRTIEELSEILRISTTACTLPSQDNRLDLSNLTGIEELRKEDMVVKVRAGTLVKELQNELATNGLALPLSLQHKWHAGPCTQLHEFLNLNFPHVLMAQHGSWRDWVIGATFVLADGSICKSGSSVVKSVAGFDVHKFLIGSMGEFAVWGSAIMRVVSTKAVKLTRIQGDFDAPIAFVQRVQAPDFEKAKAHAAASDMASCTLWHTESPARFQGDSLIDAQGISADPLPHQDLLRRAKDRFDPTNKLIGGLLSAEKSGRPVK